MCITTQLTSKHTHKPHILHQTPLRLHVTHVMNTHAQRPHTSANLQTKLWPLLCLTITIHMRACYCSSSFPPMQEEVESLGPWGAVLFVIVVMLFEMVPLFPTQPLSLASGLLFGTGKGALLMLTGVTLAALNAFLLARGVGRPLAQRVSNR